MDSILFIDTDFISLSLTNLFCLTLSFGWNLIIDDLVLRKRIHYKKFSDFPYTGEIAVKKTGSFKNGKKEGSWEGYYNDGSIWKQFSGKIKNKKNSD